MARQSVRRIGKAIVASIACMAMASSLPAQPPARQAAIPKAAKPRPNILVIVADDLGYSDLGAMGSEIRTPNIDRLIRSGLLLTNFHAGAACSPTRSMLLSGMDNHSAGVGNMMEHIADNQRGRPGYEGHLRENIASLPELLRDAGYQTYAAGKWHLGKTPETSPAARGFQRSFMLLDGGAGHFDQTGLNARSNPAPYREDGATVNLPADFGYSTDFYTRKMIGYIEQGKVSGRPFFGYLAYTAPHWPLQAPRSDIEKYSGRYDKGWEAIQRERKARMVRMGLIPASANVPAIYPDDRKWADLSPEERRVEARTMEIYAAMVDRLDQQIGEMVAYLKKTGQYDNTVIVFMSDNGAEGAPLDELPMFKTWMQRFDNSYANMGHKNSYVFYGTRWAQVGMTPLRLYKGMATEGGSRVPASITYGGMKARGRNAGLTSVMDITPTLLDLAGVAKPGSSYHGRAVLPIQGVSWAPMLAKGAGPVRSSAQGFGSELFNKMAFRQGKWKAVNAHPPFGTGTWELYDISRDPGETTNLAARYPARLAELARSWENYARVNGVVLSSTPPER